MAGWGTGVNGDDAGNRNVDGNGNHTKGVESGGAGGCSTEEGRPDSGRCGQIRVAGMVVSVSGAGAQVASAQAVAHGKSHEHIEHAPHSTGEVSVRSRAVFALPAGYITCRHKQAKAL
jgi:hypothetical protein